jgi:hypothetical protein
MLVVTTGVTAGIRTDATVDPAATGAAISEASMDAAMSDAPNDRDRAPIVNRRDALWAPSVKPGKTRASSLPDAVQQGTSDGGNGPCRHDAGDRGFGRDGGRSAGERPMGADGGGVRGLPERRLWL